MQLILTIGTLVLIRPHKKADLLEMRVNGMKNRKACVDENQLFDLVKNEGHIPSSLGSRLIVVIRPTSRQYSCTYFTKLLKFANLNSKAYLGCLNGFMVLMALYQ